MNTIFRHINTKALAMMVASVFTVGAPLMASTVIVHEDFESYTVGSSIYDQPNWTREGTGIGVIEQWDDEGWEATNPTGAVFGNYLRTAPTDGSTATVAVRSFAAQTGHIQVSTDVYMDVHTAMFVIRSGDDSVANIQFRFSPREIRAFHQDAAEGDYSLLANTFGYGQWYRINIDLFLDSNSPENGTYDVSVLRLSDGVNMGSLTGLRLENDASYIDSVRLTTSFSTSSTHGWDNLVITAIPEPGSSAVLIGSGVVVLLLLRRMRA